MTGESRAVSESERRGAHDPVFDVLTILIVVMALFDWIESTRERCVQLSILEPENEQIA